jgi:hypothetical protein
MLNAMSQGNDGSMTTIHASSSRGAFLRLAAYAAQSAERLGLEATSLLAAGAVHFVIQLVKAPGGPQRMISSIRPRARTGALVCRRRPRGGVLIARRPADPGRVTDYPKSRGLDENRHRYSGIGNPKSRGLDENRHRYSGIGNPMSLASTSDVPRVYLGRGPEPSSCAIRQISRCVMPSIGLLWSGRCGRDGTLGQAERAGARPAWTARGTRSGLASKRGANMGQK